MRLKGCYKRLFLSRHRVDNVLVVSHVAESLEDVAYLLDDVHFFQCQFQFVVLHLPKLEQLVDQAQHAAYASVHITDGLPHFCGYGRLALDALHSTLNDGERSIVSLQPSVA